jgi:hypothetical protein
VRVTDETVRALRDKYLEIKRLRDADAAGILPDPRAEMAALARRFPGALRELDELPMDQIEARLHALEQLNERMHAQACTASALEGSAVVPQWVRLQIGYHGLMRAVLRIKRSAAPAEDAAALRARLAREYVPAADEPALESLDHAALEAILRPQGGRLNPWVFARVAAACGVQADDVRRALFVR